MPIRCDKRAVAFAVNKRCCAAAVNKHPTCFTKPIHIRYNNHLIQKIIPLVFKTYAKHEAIATTPQFEGLLTFVKRQGFRKGKPAFGVINYISWRRRMELAHMRRDVTYCVSWNVVGVSNSKYGVGYSISGVNNAKCGVGAFVETSPRHVHGSHCRICDTRGFFDKL